MDKVLRIYHNAGFFSCCTVRLIEIIKYYNSNKELPTKVDSSSQFEKYKDWNRDITHFFFEMEVDTPKNIGHTNFALENQFLPYNLDNLEMDNVSPFVTKYFTPSSFVLERLSFLERKYNLNYKNICSVFYRGNDKFRETGIAEHKTFIEKAREIREIEPNIIFLVQTDEHDFLESFLGEFPDSLFFDETPRIKKYDTTVHDVIDRSIRIEAAAYFLAATLAVSKCEYLITHTGNCGLWAVLYRTHFKNVHQYLSHKDHYVDYHGWISNKK